MFAADMSWKAATLVERVVHVRDRTILIQPLSSDAKETTQDDPLRSWAQAYSPGNTNALSRRLAWDDLDVQTARTAMREDPPARDFPVAAWTHTLAELVSDARLCADDVGSPEWETRVADLGSDLPFADAWIPIVLVARRRLAIEVPCARDWLADDAVTSLERHLLTGIARRGELALLEDFRAASSPDAAGQSSGAYLNYVRGLFTSQYAVLFSTYPVLARHVALIIDQWLEYIVALVSHLEADRCAIERAFDSTAGRVRRLTPGLSDRHDGGRQVALVEFDSGLRLAYKPRDVRLEKAFHDWLSWMREAGHVVVPRPVRILDCGNHGWSEWVEQQSLDSLDAVHTCFRAAGALICVAYVLGGADLHAENVIASAEGPILIDTEMLLQPSAGTTSARHSSSQDVPADESCLTSGLVSFIAIDSAGQPFDVGGLRPSAARALTVPMRQWMNLRRDDIRFVLQHRIHPRLRNDIALNGQVQRPEDFVDQVCEGFLSTYRFLESRRDALLAADGPMRGFAGCRTRVLFRPSDQYAAAQYVMASPRYQRSGLARSLGFEMLHRVFSHEQQRPRLWPLVEDERQSLEALDIPRLTIDGCSAELKSATGAIVDGIYDRSGVETMRLRVAALSRDDLTRQIEYLRAALGARDAAPFIACGEAAREARRDEAGTQDTVAAAERVGQALLDRAVADDDGCLRWPSSSGRTDLYGGSSGIGLFFSALSAVTGRAIWRDAAERTLRQVESEVGAFRGDEWRLGACTGRFSIAYALALAAHLLGDAGLRLRAVEIAKAVPLEVIDADEVFDVEGGAAGTLIAALALHEGTRDNVLVSMAARCVSRLVSAQITTGPHRGSWQTGHDAQPHTGFAHGAAGIAYALCRWASRSGDMRVSASVHDAWDFERRIFAEHGGVWPTVRRDGGQIVMAAWCHGAPGMALARSAVPAPMMDPAVADEMATAMSQTMSAPAARLDHLCCGNLGRADIALTVGLRQRAAAWIEGGEQMARAVAERVVSEGRLGLRGRGFHLGAPRLEFFQGLAGIGYQLLRTSAPSVLPSVLAFEWPADAPETQT